MATSFDRWEKDPFFYAAEEVQEATDRMELVFRRWMREKDAAISSEGEGNSFASDLQRDLHTALGTAKWQLDELERAVRYSDHSLSAGEDTINRHKDFVTAISNQIARVEIALKESKLEDVGETGFSWVRLDAGERDELAVFLSGPHAEEEKLVPTATVGVNEAGTRMDGEASVCSKNLCNSRDLNSPEMMKNNMKGHRRVSSAFADLGDFRISVSIGGSPQKNGFRKWKSPYHDNMEEYIPLQNHQLSRGMNVCYEKSKSCLSNFSDDSSSKQFYGWLGAFQRRIQRSQYQIQYFRPIQMIVWTAFTVLLLADLHPHAQLQSPQTPVIANTPSPSIVNLYLSCAI
ncbi:hypothetical protein KSP40_PGU022772 [Platanthera guangdongensis]|uniref:Syntaxin 6/10/61 N-terminal domain-containing protein n=1 Tax=Platanthera guangdongensis TaxID=2320717 RepID=A0ABR2MGF6_9ASPA